jgi:hypothetical protein
MILVRGIFNWINFIVGLNTHSNVLASVSEKYI